MIFYFQNKYSLVMNQYFANRRLYWFKSMTHNNKKISLLDR